MELLIRVVLIAFTIAVAVYIAIKYDEYEKWNRYRIRYKVRPLTKDPVDGEWEFVRKQRRFEYVYAEEVEKDQEESTEDFGHYPYSGIDFQRCA